MEKQQRRHRDSNGYASDICDNLDGQLDVINVINTLSKQPVDDLRKSGAVPEFFIAFKEDVEELFEHIADVGINHFNIDGVRLRQYRNLIE